MDIYVPDNKNPKYANQKLIKQLLSYSELKVQGWHLNELEGNENVILAFHCPLKNPKLGHNKNVVKVIL
jgi:hypothetical protein